MSELQLRPATAADDVAIAAVIAEAFPGNAKANVDVLRWQYRRNPWGETAGFVWEERGRVVAHYSAFPMPLRIHGNATLVANAVDAAVAPSHQDRRLFRPMAGALYKACADAGVPVTFCFGTNQRALRGVAAMGWREVARLRVLVAGVNDVWLASRFGLPLPAARLLRLAAFRLGRGAVAEEVDTTPTWIGTLPTGPEHGVVRGFDWGRWRYDASPLGPYRHLVLDNRGWAAVRVREDLGGRIACILDLVASDATVANALLRGAARLEVDGAAIDGLAALAIDGTVQASLLRSAGLRPLPRRFEPRPAWFGVVDNAGCLGHLATEPWTVSWADLDHL